MAGIKVVTDSASDLDKAWRERDAITEVPLEVRIEGVALEDTSGLSPEQFWNIASSTSALAQTAAPSPGAFAQAFTDAADQGYEGVCCVTISSRLSATYEAAFLGAQEVASRIEVRVVDSLLATMGEGLVVLEAVEAARAGGSLEHVVDVATRSIGTISVFGTLDSLETLRRGGRIGSAQALLGSMLSIKPVVEVRDGVVEGESRQRTRTRSLAYLHEKVEQALPLKRLALVHAQAADFEGFVELFGDLREGVEVLTGYIGPVIGAHTGPGTIGVCFQRTSA